MPPTFWVPMAMEGWKVGVGGGGRGWGQVVERGWVMVGGA